MGSIGALWGSGDFVGVHRTMRGEVFRTDLWGGLWLSGGGDEEDVRTPLLPQIPLFHPKMRHWALLTLSLFSHPHFEPKSPFFTPRWGAGRCSLSACVLPPPSCPQTAVFHPKMWRWALLALALAADPLPDWRRRVQIGVRRRPEECGVRSRRGDLLHMHYTVLGGDWEGNGGSGRDWDGNGMGLGGTGVGME